MTSFVSAARATERTSPVLHGFLDGHRPVFASYHAPTRPLRDIGWVVCPPLGWEAIQSYETVRRLAEGLAAAGLPTVRVHYDGTGESLGSDEDGDRVDAWLESIRRAVVAMRELGVRDVGLVGVRLGATLAAHVATELAVASLVLWEPCTSGAHYTREMEILASASPSAVRDRAHVRQPGDIEAGGYLLTRETVASLAAIDLLKATLAGKPDVLLVYRDDRPAPFGKKLAERFAGAVLEQLPGYKEMMTYPERATPADAAIARIRAWASERAGTLEREPPSLALREDVVEGTSRRRPVRFGPDGRLFGVLTEPLAGRTREPVILLTGGVVPRIAVNRMYVTLATRLAERGHAVLRFDVSGICESTPADGAKPNDPHAASLLSDVRDAVERMGGSSVSLLGLCSGAYAAFQTALADTRVQQIVLLNPQVFHLADGSPKFSQTEQSQAAKYYRQRLFQLDSWKKLLSGKANVRYITGFVTAKAKTTLNRARERVLARVTHAPRGLAGDLHGLLKRGVRIRVVMAEGEPGHEPLMTQLGEDLEALRGLGFVLDLTPGPDHTFNDFAVRLPLLDRLTDTLSR